MKTVSRIIALTISVLTLSLAPLAANAGGVEHFEWSTNDLPEPLIDYSDCTDEEVLWVVTVREGFKSKENPAGQGHYMDHWVFEGTVEGLTTGYIWKTKGIVQVTGTYSLDNTLNGGEAWLENAALKPITPDAPRVRLDVKSTWRYNANGDLVADRFVYTYHCVGD